MKNTLKLIGIIALVTVIGFSMIACGGGDPKSLAKQSAELALEAFSMMGEAPGSAKYEAYMKKSEALAKKIEKLSEADKKIFEEEFSKQLGF